MPTAPPLGRILAELLGGTRSSPPEAPSQRADRAIVQRFSTSVWQIVWLFRKEACAAPHPSGLRPATFPQGKVAGTFSIPHCPEKGNRNPLREAGGGGFSIQGIRFTEHPSSC